MPLNSKSYRIIIWSTIAAYTLMLPWAIIFYRKLENTIGPVTTGKIPLTGIIIIGLAYLFYGFFKNTSKKHLWFLLPSCIIAFIIIKLESNPNKHIHIPEYMLMAWLLYAALYKDYQGKGVFSLIFICGSMLGIVDELEQGLHPGRYYGWRDMVVNSASVLIGIFFMLGLQEKSSANEHWQDHLKYFRPLLTLNAFGFIAAVLMCITLFQVQANGSFNNIYPQWLLAWQILFLLLVPVTIVYQHNYQIGAAKNKSFQIAQLWVYPILYILCFMHIIIAVAAVSGIRFQ